LYEAAVVLVDGGRGHCWLFFKYCFGFHRIKQNLSDNEKVKNKGQISPSKMP
jgi:hypothetical protein